MKNIEITGKFKWDFDPCLRRGNFQFSDHSDLNLGILALGFFCDIDREDYSWNFSAMTGQDKEWR